MIEQAIGKIVSFNEWQNSQTITNVKAMAIAKNNSTPLAPSATSPAIFAKPII